VWGNATSHHTLVHAGTVGFCTDWVWSLFARFELQHDPFVHETEGSL
jgi:hypothetical protein